MNKVTVALAVDSDSHLWQASDSVVYILGSSVAQEPEYQTQKKGENDSAIGTSIRTSSQHHIAASNVSHSCTAINKTDFPPPPPPLISSHTQARLKLIVWRVIMFPIKYNYMTTMFQHNMDLLY